MSGTLPSLPSRTNRPNVSLPSIPSVSSAPKNVDVEMLLIKLEHDYDKRTTEISFTGEGFDDQNEDIIKDILDSVASTIGYVLVHEDDVTYEDEED